MDARRMPILWPHAILAEDWANGRVASGSTEPWVIQIVSSLMVASARPRVLEIGTYQGFASTWLCLMLQNMGGGTFHGVEIDPERAKWSRDRLASLSIPDVEWEIYEQDSHAFLERCEPGAYGFAWVDGSHDPLHVGKELQHLVGRRVVQKDGLICMHDVEGAFNLGPICKAFGGYVLDFPHLHVAAGGLGIIRVGYHD